MDGQKSLPMYRVKRASAVNALVAYIVTILNYEMPVPICFMMQNAGQAHISMQG